MGTMTGTFAALSFQCGKYKNCSAMFCRYFFCSMNAVNFMFMTRLSLDLKNQSVNAASLKYVTRTFGFTPL